MRIRCLAFVPPAALVTAIVFLLTSSIVSAIEARLTPRALPASYAGVVFSDASGSTELTASTEPQPIFLVSSAMLPSLRPELRAMRAQTDCHSLQRGVERVTGASILCEHAIDACEAGDCATFESSAALPFDEAGSEPDVFLF